MGGIVKILNATYMILQPIYILSNLILECQEYLKIKKVVAHFLKWFYT